MATIKRGAYTGYKARVLSATTTHVRVELEASQRIISIERKWVNVRGERGVQRGGRERDGMQHSLPPTTPMHPGGRTPVHPGSQTPMHSWVRSSPLSLAVVALYG
jgi:hypothetical protein